MARDLDLCRDEDLIPDLNADGTPVNPGSRPWKCNFCDAEYDRLAIEERMIGEVERIVVEWSTQDLKCGKCRSIKVNDFMEHCSCSGEWVETLRKEDILRRLRVYKNVGSFYGLRMLADVVKGVFAEV